MRTHRGHLFRYAWAVSTAPTLFVWAATLGLASCATPSPPPASPPPSPSASAVPAPKVAAPNAATDGGVAPLGLDRAGMDMAVPPGDDFFAHANGTWVKHTEIPSDRGHYGTSAMMTELVEKRTADLIAQAAQSNAEAGSDVRRVADTYRTFMDEQAIEALGMKPLLPTLTAISKISDKTALARALGASLRADVDILNNTNLITPNLFGLWVAQDLDEPTRYAAFLLQGGLGMPDRDYYLDPSPRMEELRTRYKEHLSAALALANIPDAKAKAARIFDLERRIATVHVSRVDSSDVRKGNNHVKASDFATLAPGLDWKAFFEAAKLAKQDTFVLWQKTAVTGLAALVRSQPLDVWKDYLAVHAIDRASPFLSRAFVNEHFSFYAKTLLGIPALRERWKRAVEVADDALGDAVGRMYVERYFPASEKARAEEMVRHEIEAFGRHIETIDWMDPKTKTMAKAKLRALKVGVGYPDHFRDYSGLEVIVGDALGNAERAALFEYARNLAKLGKPVDRGEWVMTPHLVNAVNLPAMNALNFPAALLSPPEFDPSRPLVMDYGAAGAIIGHEICHSFDDQGALFDAEGRLKNWWTPEDLARFQASAERLVKQYNGYRPFPDLGVNGALTVSENIADVAGLAAAYQAYRLAFGGKEAPTVDGLTGDQQFFLSFAQSWRIKYREPALRQRLLTDSHAPGQYRANTVRNLDAWYDAFNVKPGQALYLEPAARVRVW